LIIYGLTDPRDNLIRYVGKTTDRAKRLRAHLYAARRGRTYRLPKWIRKLEAEGVKPSMVTLEECDAASVDERERFHIARLRSEGFDLLNHTDGGDGGPTMKGKRFTAEHRRRISEALKGHAVTDNNRQKSSERLTRLLHEGRVGRAFPKGVCTGRPFPKGVSSGIPFQKGRAATNKVEFDDSLLIELYTNQRLTTRAVAARLGVSQRPVIRRIHELGIQRSRSEAHSLANLSRTPKEGT
jgi:hypothetical protein